MDNNPTLQWQRVALTSSTADEVYLEVLGHGGREKVGLTESIPFERITTILEGIAEHLGKALEKASPTKATVELGVEFALQEGKLVALIARGSGKANLKVSLEWDRTPSE